MTDAMKHMILTEVEGLDEATLEANTIKLTDSSETCLKKLVKVIEYMGENNNRAWVYFLDIYNDIPVSCRRVLMLEEIYHHSEVDYPDMLGCLKKYITEDETAELKAQRISEVKEYLGNAIDADGKVLLYRGISEGKAMPDYSVCWTLSKEVAENYTNERLYGAGKIVEAKFDVEDILYCTDNYDDHEVFVIPRCIKEGWDVFAEDDGVNYNDEHSVQRLHEDLLEKMPSVYDPYDEYPTL